jgi:hypothetical protein
MQNATPLRYLQIDATSLIIVNPWLRIEKYRVFLDAEPLLLYYCRYVVPDCSYRLSIMYFATAQSISTILLFIRHLHHHQQTLLHPRLHLRSRYQHPLQLHQEWSE